MTVRVGSLNTAPVSLFGFLWLRCRLIGACQHAKRVSFIFGDSKVTLQCFDHLRGSSNLLILLRQAKENAAVDWIIHQHLLEDVDARGSHCNTWPTADSKEQEFKLSNFRTG